MRKFSEVDDDEITTSFDQIAHDLAEACRGAGEEAKIDVGDAADAVYNHLISGGVLMDHSDVEGDFRRIRKVLRARWCRGRSRYIEL